MIHWLLLPMAISHVAAAYPALSAFRRGTLPSPPIAAAISFLLYYDFGLAFELLGFAYQVPYFPSLFEAPRDTQLAVVCLLIVAPWVLLAGARLVQPRPGSVDAERMPRAWLKASRRGTFYAIAVAVTAIPAWYGLTRFLNGDELWNLRLQVGSDLGPLIILLYLPMHLLAFYASLDDARTPSGRVFTLFLAFGAIGSSIICSQRTLMLFPVILATLSFYRRISLLKAAGVATVCFVAAAAMLPMFRGVYRDKDLRKDNLVVEIVHNDFSRAGVLATAVDLSRPVGTDILSYPMSGYVYSSLLFIPRQVAPYKGRSTAMQFTGYLVNLRPEWLNWGFGVGMLEELILNVGLRYCLLGVFVYGLVIGLLARTELKYPAVSMPLRLGPLFLCAYHLPSLLVNFGLMWLVCIQLSWIFAEQKGVKMKTAGRLRETSCGTSHLRRRIGAW